MLGQKKPREKEPALTTQETIADGRKLRWQGHKIARREELVDGTLEAIRVRGSNAGMDEIAAEIGVSKTVLYRYFSDKGDLTRAVMARFVETVLAPNIFAAIGAPRGSSPDKEYQLARAAVAAYVETVDADPDVYRYVMGNGAGPDGNALAEAEQLFAGVVRATFVEYAAPLGIDTAGADAWAYAIVGAIHLATHWWLAHKPMPVERFIDYLTMLAWGAITAIARDGGSVDEFRSRPHPLPGPDKPAAANTSSSDLPPGLA